MPLNGLKITMQTTPQSFNFCSLRNIQVKCLNVNDINISAAIGP